jgi:RimJ/RimL family protein N-acetyltransferase
LVILVRDCTPVEVDAGGLITRWASADDADQYARSIGTDSAVTFARRLDGHARCFLVLEQDTIVHATWCTTASAWTRELHAYLTPPRKDAYVYESFTRPEMRGKSVYPLALRALASELHRAGVSRVWVGVEAGNAASLRAVSKAGFETAYSIDFGRRWGRVWVASERTPDAVESLHITANPAVTGPSGG